MTDLIPSEPTTAPRRSRATFAIVSILAAVFFLSTVVLAVVAAGLKSDKDELVGGSTEVASAAGQFVDALLSYDHSDAGGYRERVLALTAPPFTDQFEEAVGQLQEQFEGLDAVSEPTVRDVFVTDVEEGTATAIVQYDRVLNGTGGPRSESNLYVRLGLVERDDGWRVNDVVNLNLAIANAGTGGSATTTTSGSTPPASG